MEPSSVAVEGPDGSSRAEQVKGRGASALPPMSVCAVISPGVGRPWFQVAIVHVSSVLSCVTLTLWSGRPIRMEPSDEIENMAPSTGEVWTSSPSSANGCTGRAEMVLPRSPFTAASAPASRAMSLVCCSAPRPPWAMVIPIEAPWDGSIHST